MEFSQLKATGDVSTWAHYLVLIRFKNRGYAGANWHFKGHTSAEGGFYIGTGTSRNFKLQLIM